MLSLYLAARKEFQGVPLSARENSLFISVQLDSVSILHTKGYIMVRSISLKNTNPGEISMHNLTKMKISKPAKDLFEAFVDPSRIGNFWFSSSSERWEQGKTITLWYDEYGAQGDIKIIEIEENKKIVFQWGDEEEGHAVTITLNEMDNTNTIIEVKEEGFNENDDQLISNLLDNKEGWVYMLTCLKGYLEFGANLRASLVK
jgi:uncharacterized protein YndB with AHSA1/START domain